MATYVTRTESLKVASLRGTDHLIVLYKENETLPMGTVMELINSAAEKEFVSYKEDSDLLVMLGYLVSEHKNVIIMDKEFVVPEFLKDKVKLFDESVPKKRKYTRRKKVEASETKPVAKKVEEKPAEPVRSDSKNEVPKKKEVVKEEPKKRGRKKKESADIAPKRAESIKSEPKTRGRKKKEQTIFEPKAKKEEELQSDPVGLETPVVSTSPVNNDLNDKKARLQKLLGITSEDIGYSFDTQFLMGRVIDYVSKANTDEEIRNTIEFNVRSDVDHKLADAVMKNLAEVKKIVFG